MSLASLVVVLIFVWTVIYGAHYLFRPSRTQSLLPSTSASRGRRDIWDTHITQVTLKNVHLRIQTTAWNLRHDAIAAGLKRQKRYSKILTSFYDVGCILGIVGMSAGFGFLLWTCGQAAFFFVQKILQDPVQGVETVNHLKRGLKTSNVTTLSHGYESFVKPIVPGVTVPLAHLPLILLAIFAAQVFHEFGHALAAALEALPMLSAGAALTLTVPSAFVTFPKSALEALTSRARLRIVSAGPFHNAVLWGFLMSVQYLGTGHIFWSLGYQDVSDMGKVVIGVDSISPLHGHLLPGSIITKLDDTPLGLVNTSQNVWASYLTSSNEWDQRGSLGWCVDQVTETSEICCVNKTVPGTSCFVLMDDSKRRVCLDPVPILTATNPRQRCTSKGDCISSEDCIVPDSMERLLRVTVRTALNGLSNVVLWSGPLDEIWEEVEVGNLLPRLGILPVWLPPRSQIFWQYLLMGTLSLFFLNLLPLPYLDGSQVLETAFDVAFDDEFNTADHYDMEALEESRSIRRWKERLSRAIQRITTGLFGLSAMFWIIQIL